MVNLANVFNEEISHTIFMVKSDEALDEGAARCASFRWRPILHTITHAFDILAIDDAIIAIDAQNGTLELSKGKTNSGVEGGFIGIGK